MKQTIIAIVVLVIVILGGWQVYKMSTGSVGQEPNATSTADQMAVTGSGTYAVDPSASTLKWEGRKVVLKNYTDNGSIKAKSGTVVIADGKLVGGEVVVDMTTIKGEHTANTTIGIDKLDTHLKSDDFFGVETYPTATLKITDVSETDEMNYQVTADLTIKGKTAPITFPATVYMADGQLVVEANLVVDRTIYDVRFGSGKFFEDLGDNVIDDMFSLEVRLVAGN